MKKYTHAWLAFMAMERLQKTHLSVRYRKYADSLLEWFMNNRDFVIQGAWYPDSVIKDMATSHILKYEPLEKTRAGHNPLKRLPTTFNLLKLGKESPIYKNEFKVVKGNLPDRCDALAHGIIDKLKMQEIESKGSPISPTDNHIATSFFMLSHYIADAHMPLHCDTRPFSEFANIHAKIEEEWDDIVRHCYQIDFNNERFFYNPEGYPLKANDHPLQSYLENDIIERKYVHTWGKDNRNTWDFISAITQYSYLTAYKMIPKEEIPKNLNWEQFLAIDSGKTFEEYSQLLLSDAIDSIAKVWLRVWMKYCRWLNS